MTDTSSVTFPQGEQDAQSVAAEGKPVHEKPLTRAELEAALEERDRKIRIEQQSLRARKKRAEEQAKGQVEVMKSLGTALTPEQELAYIKNSASRFESAFDNEEDAAQQQQNSQTPQQLTPQQQMVENAYKKFGVTLMETDPEAQELSKTQDFDDWYPDFLAALKKKAQRANTPPQARIPSPAMGGNTGPSEDQYISEMFAARGNRAGVEVVKEKFRKMGLDVDHINLYKR